MGFLTLVPPGQKSWLRHFTLPLILFYMLCSTICIYTQTHTHKSLSKNDCTYTETEERERERDKVVYFVDLLNSSSVNHQAHS
ncbi:hypothetical protein QVD17_01995 [Tagetes erecta]|uniref:Uncharacterized protein n=1 Tax=Tagetes erecta TaxID=13708 RepID=A0AAD8P8M5_TARER|nr:hypothetical protein QVD17_01995 [Tagetes erecta]